MTTIALISDVHGNAVALDIRTSSSYAASTSRFWSTPAALASRWPQVGRRRSRLAHYALVAVDDVGAVEATVRQVAVDFTEAGARAEASGMPYGDQWAEILPRRVTRSNERARARALADARRVDPTVSG